ncbi:restriction endonuclease [Sulfuricaulis sp.]|uniref:restriction endonuclease n=1 Tax=Sulfuricaulis sp. TaxID=2003553 RepID=UPI0034A2440A
MHRPDLSEFGVNQQDVEWTEKTEGQLPLVLFVISALAWGVYALSNTESFHLGLALLFLFLGFAVIFLTTMVLMFPAELLLRFLVPRYRRAQRYRKALEKFRAWWVRTQKEFWSSLSGKQFEAELATVFRRAGFRAELTSATGDQGVDIWLPYRAR